MGDRHRVQVPAQSSRAQGSRPGAMDLLRMFERTQPPNDKAYLIAILRLLVSRAVLDGGDIDHSFKSHMEERDDDDDPFVGRGAHGTDEIDTILERRRKGGR
jgi:hypothetical protein